MLRDFSVPAWLQCTGEASRSRTEHAGSPLSCCCCCCCCFSSSPSSLSSPFPSSYSSSSSSFFFFCRTSLRVNILKSVLWKKKKKLLSELSRAAPVLAQKGKRHSILVEACSRVREAGSGIWEKKRGGPERRGGRQGAPPLTFPRVEGGGAGLSDRPGQEAWGDLGGIHVSPPLTNACYRLTKQTRVCTRLSSLSAGSDAQSPGTGFHPPRHLNYGEAGGRARVAPERGK